jgi:hypothetical protein
VLSGGALLERLKGRFPALHTHATFPFLRVDLVSEAFVGKAEEECEELAAEAAAVTVAELRSTLDRLFIRLELRAPGEPDLVSQLARGATWLGERGDRSAAPIAAVQAPQVVHFYGYKGGQGRTTFLCVLAQALARDGYRVLVVDLDAEAPSLDLVLATPEVPPEASIVGLRGGLEVVPMNFLAAGNGAADLVAFRPSAEEYDIDAVALAFEAGIHAPTHEKLAGRLRDSVAQQYDVMLVDHRTGLGPTVPAWVRSLPGPVVVFDRLDGQSRRAARDVPRIWRGLENPGLLVSLALHAGTREQFRQDKRGDAWPWLEALARAKSERADEPLAPEDVADDHWQIVLDDPAFRGAGIPQWPELSPATQAAVQGARSVLGLSKSTSPPAHARALHPSGAQDEGSFIVTDALRTLRQPGSPIRFVFGRKGTGKTRLVHELARANVAEPLVVADDEGLGGLRSTNPRLQDLLFKQPQREQVWWSLLVAALKIGTTRPDDLEKELAQRSDCTALDARNTALSAAPRVFLIDGLETIAKREEAKQTIAALLRVHAALQNDPQLRTRISLRIFLRSDIARWGFENLEQLTASRELNLFWTTQTIFNFVLSRLPNLPQLRRLFPDVISEVVANRDAIENASLPVEQCTALLLRIFPERLGRLNMRTETFLRTYFSDDPNGEQSYYPRVYDKFLQVVDADTTKLSNGRVEEVAIMRAHEAASDHFLLQVKTELGNLTPLPSNDLDRLLARLKGQTTPFDHRALREKLRNSLKFKKGAIDTTFQAMLELGIFEEHPRHDGTWRAGRLFKAALKMKYGRGQG